MTNKPTDKELMDMDSVQNARAAKREERQEMFELVSDFKDAIEMAKMSGDEWVETTEEVINYFNKGGLKGAPYFIYNGVKVCRNGDLEKVEDYMNRDLYVEAHGAGSGKRIGLG